MQFISKPNTLEGEIGIYRNVSNFILLNSPIPARQETKLIGMITLKGANLTATRKTKAFQAPCIIPSGNKHGTHYCKHQHIYTKYIENRPLEIAYKIN